MVIDEEKEAEGNVVAIDDDSDVQVGRDFGVRNGG